MYAFLSYFGDSEGLSLIYNFSYYISSQNQITQIWENGSNIFTTCAVSKVVRLPLQFSLGGVNTVTFSLDNRSVCAEAFLLTAISC